MSEYKKESVPTLQKIDNKQKEERQNNDTIYMYVYIQTLSGPLNLTLWLTGLWCKPVLRNF